MDFELEQKYEAAIARDLKIGDILHHPCRGQVRSLRHTLSRVQVIVVAGRSRRLVNLDKGERVWKVTDAGSNP